MQNAVKSRTTTASAINLIGVAIYLSGLAGRTTGDLYQRYRRRRALRRDLKRLDDRMLKDIGLSRQDLANEANKPIWYR